MAFLQSLHPHRTAFFICLIFFKSPSSWSEGVMTPQRFKELAGMKGDNIALRPELASLPFWKNAKCSITMKYQDGKVSKEDCLVTAKTIEGRFLVFSMESQFYKHLMYSIVGYDEKAAAIRHWGLFGETLTEATIVIDPKKQASASTARYGDGFEEITVETSSETEVCDHSLVYKNGVLFMTRDAITRPVLAE